MRDGQENSNDLLIGWGTRIIIYRVFDRLDGSNHYGRITFQSASERGRGGVHDDSAPAHTLRLPQNGRARLYCQWGGAL